MKTAAGWLCLELAGDVLQERLFFSGRHDEAGVERWLAAHQEELRGATVFDIGGHVGYWAMQLAAAVGETGRVLAFEPQPELAAAIGLAAGWNGLPWLEVVAAAVAARPGELTLSRPPDRGRTSFAAVQDSRESFLVPTLQLDLFCRERGIWPDLLKIDIEGAEWLALQGMEALLAERRPRLLLEVHPRQILSLGGSQEALIGRLHAAGYTLEHLADDACRPLEALPGGLPVDLPRGSAWHLLATPR